MKRFLNAFSVITLLLINAILMSCSSYSNSSHEHTFAKEWSSDTENHWYASTCGHDVKKRSCRTYLEFWRSNNRSNRNSRR